MAIFRDQFFFSPFPPMFYLDEIEEYEIVSKVNHKRSEKKIWQKYVWTMHRVITPVNSTRFLSNEFYFQVSLRGGKKSERAICISSENSSLSSFWGCRMNIFQRNCETNFFWIQNPMWNRNCSTSKMNSKSNLVEKQQIPIVFHKFDFPKARKKSEKNCVRSVFVCIQEARTRFGFNETNCKRIAGMNADNMCCVVKSQIRANIRQSALKFCLHYILASTSGGDADRAGFCEFTPNQLKHFQWARSWVFACSCCNGIHAAHSDIPLCCTLLPFRGPNRTQIVYAIRNRMHWKHVQRVHIYFALPKNYTKTQTMRIRHSAHRAFTATVTKLRCFYAHDFIRKSDDYRENGARRLIGIIRSYLFCCFFFFSFSVLVAVAHILLSWFSNPSDCVSLHCDYSTFAIWTYTNTLGLSVRLRGRFIAMFTFWCFYLLFFIDLGKPASDFSICK